MYRVVVQSILSFSLICAFDNMHNQGHHTVGCSSIINMSRWVTGCDQKSAAQSFKELILSNAEHIFSGPTDPLHNRFQLSHGGKRKIARISKSLGPSANRLLKKRDSTKGLKK